MLLHSCFFVLISRRAVYLDSYVNVKNVDGRPDLVHYFFIKNWRDSYKTISFVESQPRAEAHIFKVSTLVTPIFK